MPEENTPDLSEEEDWLDTATPYCPADDEGCESCQ